MFEFNQRYESAEEIDAPYLSLYEEKKGGMEMIGPLAKKVHDLGNLGKTLDKERESAKTANQKLNDITRALGDIDADKLSDVIEEYYTLKDKADSGELNTEDPEKLEALVTQRIERVQRGHEREVERLKSELARSTDNTNRLDGLLRSKSMDQDLSKAAIKIGVQEHSIEDAVAKAKQVFEPDDDYKPKAKQESGYDSTFNPEQFFEEIKNAGQRPGWWYKPSSQGVDLLNGGTSGGKPSLKRADFDAMPPAQQMKLAGELAGGKLQLVD